MAVSTQLTSVLGPRSKQTLSGKRYSHQTAYSSVELGDATILFIRKKQQLRQLPDNETGVVDPGDPIVEFYSSVLQLLPRGVSRRRKITASFRQYIMYQSTVLLKPVLSFASVIPNDAQVWDYIQTDDVTNLQRLLENGLSALSDCDSGGRSLLAVSATPTTFSMNGTNLSKHAVYHSRPNVTKFLIEHGLDIDEVVSNRGPPL